MAVFLDTHDYENDFEGDDFDGETKNICENLDSANEHLFIQGSVGRWNGTSRGVSPVKGKAYDAFCEMFKDCEIFTFGEEADGLLTMTGWHHDGAVTISWYTIEDTKKFNEKFDFDFEGDIVKINDDGEIDYEFDFEEVREMFVPAKWK